MTTLPRSRAVMAAVAAAVALATAAGCSSGHGDGPSATPGRCQPAASARCTLSTAPGEPAGPLTVQQAASILTRYSKINNAANKAVSRMLNSEAETGPLQGQTRAQYLQYPYLDSRAREEFGAFAYRQAHFYIPRAVPGQAPWFAAIAEGVDQATGRTWTAYLVFVETAPGTWRMAAAAGQPRTAPVPAIALDDHGYATAVDPDTTGLAVSPFLLSIATTDNYVSGGQHEGRTLAPTAATTQAREAYRHRDDGLRPYAAGSYGRLNDPYHTTSVWSLRTTDGGVLTISSATHGKTDVVTRPGEMITIPDHAPARAWLKTSRVHSVTTEWTCLDAAQIPRRGAVRLLAEDCEITGATT